MWTAPFVLGMALNCSAQDDTLLMYLAEAAGGVEKFAGEPAGVLGGEEDGDGGDVAGLADASERSLGLAVLLPFTADEADGVRAFGLDQAGIDGVDADVGGPSSLASTRVMESTALLVAV